MGWDEAGSQHLGLWVLMMLGVLFPEACQAHPIPDSSPLLQFGGQVRQRFLYTDDAQETEVHLEIKADGTVVGTARRSPESLLELKALKPGVIQILGVKTSRFLCQGPDGTLYGSPAASGNCFWRTDTTSTTRRPSGSHSACPPTTPHTGTRPPGHLPVSCRCQACFRHPRSLQGSWPPSPRTWAPRTL
ncbi:fibroblast growth factor 21 isoform X2 [Lynx canadensis]|uniref:fibroblast growth factor 21 isoform X2 n=1 Tax=Lynx canadensis TaxID=61383 RepID=UPI0011B02463|nr:fibroblast growth factor 21 isoform X2 [Lynx canadensis]